MTNVPPKQPPLIDQLIAKYCVTDDTRAADLKANRPGETAPVPGTKFHMSNHKATAFIDGLAYFTAIDEEIDRLIGSPAQKRFFHLTAWWLELLDLKGSAQVGDTTLGVPTTWRFDSLNARAFELPKSKKTLLQRLEDLANAGVTVRVLPWVFPFAASERVERNVRKGSHIFAVLLSADALRQKLAAASTPGQVVLNMLAHPLGAAHTKLVIGGDEAQVWAYTSGLDPHWARLLPPVTSGSDRGGWHDVGVKVEGYVASAINRFFHTQWNEQLKHPVETFTLNGKAIPSHDKSWHPLPEILPTRPVRTVGTQYVQMLRTVPRIRFDAMNATRWGRLLKPRSSAPTQAIVGKFVRERIERQGLSFAPNGIFEFKVALEKAIMAAERYIFIADQSLQAFEVMDWIHQRLEKLPRQLKVILVHGYDPDDRQNAFLPEAINNHLVFNKKINSNNIVFYRWGANTVHSKVTLVDDVWCAIGSANNMRRSLYTDIELSVGILEEPTPAHLLPDDAATEANPIPNIHRAPSFIQRFRRDLWAYYCGISPDPARRSGQQKEVAARMLDLDTALTIWSAIWAGSGLQVMKPLPNMQWMSVLPFHTPTGAVYNEIDYDLEDVNSLQFGRP